MPRAAPVTSTTRSFSVMRPSPHSSWRRTRVLVWHTFCLSSACMSTQDLRNSPMMAHLLDALSAGQDIGHYGRLVFAMVAHHFLDEDELVEWLRKDRDFSDDDARALVRKVEGRDYNPPRRERILEWQSQQDFPICPNPDDPDA